MTIKTIRYPDSASHASTSSQNRLWMAAIKPPMYSVAMMPIALGTAIAYGETHHIHWGIFATFLLAAIFILAWENLSNDVFDAETGIDRHKAHSLVNLTGNKPLIFWIANGLLLSGIGGIVTIAWWQQDVTILGIILLCCGLGYAYQGPPFRLGYQGLGEILCFFSFGPLAVSAAYYSQTQTWSAQALAASFLLGLSTSLVLFCSHFHQVEDDLAAGKRSPIVHLGGTANAAKLLPWAVGSLYGLTGLGVGLGAFPLWTLFILGSGPQGWHLCRYVNTHHAQPDLMTNSKFLAISLHFWSGLWLCLGFGLG